MKNLFILTILGLATITSCNRVEGTSGKVTTEYRQEPSFSKVHIEGNIDVYLTQDTSFSVKVEAGENLIGFIETNVVNGEMLIHEANNNILNAKPIRVYINGDSLSKLTIEGDGNFDGNNLKSDNLDILILGSGNANLDVAANHVNYKVKGSGDAIIVGNTNTFEVVIEGSGDLDAKSFNANDAIVNISGSGNARVKATNSININITGSGDLDYYGNPATVNTNITGSGSATSHY